MVRQKSAFSLVELIIIIAFLVVFAAIAVPRMNFAFISKRKADTVARKIVTDLRRTRTLAISDAATNTNGYALNMTGAGPYTGYEIVNLNTSTTITNGTFSIDSDISCTGGNDFRFGPLGNLLSGSDTQLTVSAEGKIFTITIISATGTVKCTEN
jgi:Tfp pilus assembly protein FimT